MPCSKCGSLNQTFKQGVGKNTGKPYKGNKCNDCNAMDFINDKRPSSRPPEPQPKYNKSETDANITAQCLTKIMGQCEAYKDMTREQKREAIYDDYILFKNRVINPSLVFPVPDNNQPF